MRLTRKQTICNIPILKIRDYFDHIRPAKISPDMIREHFELNQEQTDELIQELLNNEYIEPSEGKYQLTIKGHALCVARYTSPLNKAKADKLFKEFMERVEEVNTNEYYLYKVSKIVLFGSYIDPEKTEFDRLNDLRLAEAEAAGKTFTSFIDQIGYTERVVILKLKNKSRYISLHRMDDAILKITKTKQVYP